MVGESPRKRKKDELKIIEFSLSVSIQKDDSKQMEIGVNGLLNRNQHLQFLLSQQQLYSGGSQSLSQYWLAFEMSLSYFTCC